MRERFAALALALALDFALGDPAWLPHPVVFIGRYIAKAEVRLRRRGGNLRRAAVLLTLSTVLLTAACAAALTAAALRLPSGPRIGCTALLLWPGLAARSMVEEALGVQKALRQGLRQGRERLSRIVGRDPAALAADEVIRAAVATVAENTTDGVTSPMFYALLGGPVLLWAFKAASTLDSMVGYLDERYRDIGWCSAKLDDVLNYVPARMTGLAMCLAAQLCALDGREALRILVRDHGNHLSPNCAWTEAAAAGALHIRLGGSHTYFGKTVEKPAIGDDGRPPEPEDIGRACRLLIVTSLLVLGLFALLTAAEGRIWG